MRYLLAISIFWLFQGVVFAQPDVKSGEYFIGTIDPGVGSGVSFSVVDGLWDEVTESIVASAQTITSSNSPTLINIRLKDNSNNWGPLFKKTIFTGTSSLTSRTITITSAEYFFGVIDPGEGQGTPLLAFDGAFDEAVESILKTNANWPAGNQTTLFNIRVKDTDNKWGPLYKKVIFTDPALPSNRTLNINYAEFFFGVIDPGEGQGTPLLAFDGAFDEAVESILKTNANWPAGNQTTLFNIRVKDTDNKWGPLYKKVIFTDPALPSNRTLNISYAEYYFGVFDPGEGQGTPILAFDGAFNEAVESIIRTNATWTVTNQPTLFNIRLKDTDNKWGPLFKKTIFPIGANPNAELIAEGDSLRVCPNSTVTLTYNGPNGYTPTWFNGFVGNSTSFTIASPGYYRVTASLGNSSYKDSIYIDFFTVPEPVLSPSGSILVCGSSVISLNTNVLTNTSYQWYYNNNIINGATNANYLPTQIGSYFVRTTTNLSGCVRTSNVVTLLSAASISPANNVVSCTTPVQLNAPLGTGNTYQWKLNGVNIVGANTPSFNASASGNYSVTMTNGACSSTSPITNVTITTTATTPIITASGSTTFCTGGSVVLTSSSAT
ncbi:MAG: hypothetical protein NWR86_00005, partial [Schleiferiaceae bacterium]|nr:hypothetical protein [Schleiferiaceae bacterium]